MTYNPYGHAHAIGARVIWGNSSEAGPDGFYDPKTNTITLAPDLDAIEERCQITFLLAQAEGHAVPPIGVPAHAVTRLAFKRAIARLVPLPRYRDVIRQTNDPAQRALALGVLPCILTAFERDYNGTTDELEAA